MGETNILSIKAFDIAHHLSLGAVFLEDLFLQVIHLANVLFADSPEPFEGIF